jgi:hypothetical protein
LYNIPAAVRLSGTLHQVALQQGLQEIVRRHEALRTRFGTSAGQPVQIVALVLTVGLPMVDLRGLPEPAREEMARRLATAEARRSFDLMQGPLLRVTLLSLDEAEHSVLLTMHHIISDGWSIGVFIHELTALYQAFSEGKATPLPELAIQYPDYAQWQREWLQGDELEREVRYWREQLHAAPELLDLPTDHPRSARPSFRGALQTHLLPPALTRSLLTLSRREGVTLFMTLLGAFQALLHRYSCQREICVGTPIAGRSWLQTERLIGFFVNTLVLRTDLSGRPRWRELLRRVREVALGAYTHQDLPFEKLVEELQPGRYLSHSPLFQVMFTLQGASAAAEEVEGLSWGA